MIFLVIVTLLLYRGAQINTGVFPYAHGAFASQIVGHWLAPLGYGTNSVLEVVFLLAQVAVVMAFLVIVVYSKHLHIFLAPVNVLYSRRPNALGPLEPMRSGGKVLDFEEADPDTDTFGLGKIEDFTWKGLLDMGTCTECGRCQSQCPAWATGKPLSPKQVILDLVTTRSPRPRTCWPPPMRSGRSCRTRPGPRARGGAAGGRAGDRRSAPPLDASEVPPGEMTALLDWWKAELDRLKVEVRVGTAVTPESADGLAADEVLIATGAVWEIPEPLLGLFGPCPTSHEVLLDPSGVKKSVIVVGGSEAGLNAAIALAESGRTTTLIESAAIGPEISDLMRNEMVRQAHAADVQLLDHTTLTAADRHNEAWKLSLTREGDMESTVSAQDVVISAAPRSGVGIWNAVPGVRFLGTVATPAGRLYQATQDGFWATAEI